MVFKYFPHKRYLPEDYEAASIQSNSDDSADSVSDIKVGKAGYVSQVQKEVDVATEKESEAEYKSPTVAILQDQSGKEYRIREFKDQANRHWYDVFDEFEYRETTEEASKYKWNRWFREDMPDAEKRLVWKLDFFIAFASFVGYWAKYLDSSNLSNAYVSGMKESIGMKGNDLVNTQLSFNVGNCLFELPFLFILPHVPIPYLLGAAEIGWSAFTLGTSGVKSTGGLEAVRFFVGSFEAAYFPCIHYTLSSWYLPSEVSRRGALFYMGQFLGVLTSGLLQSAIYNDLDGANGWEGWRYMYIVDGFISVAVGIMALFCFPGTPFSCYSLFLTDDEIRIARKRMIENGSDARLHIDTFFDKSKWKQALSSWQVWVLSIYNMFGFNTNSTSSGSFALWLKSLDKYSVGKIDNLTAVPPALGLIWIVIVCGGADITRRRFLMINFSFIMNFISNIILAIWDVPYGAKWYGFLTAYWSWSQSSTFYPLLSDMFRGDNEVKTVAWMTIYIVGLQSSVWLGRLMWPTTQSPRFHLGFSSCAYFSLGALVTFSIAFLFFKRDEKRESLNQGIFTYNSKKESLEDALASYKVKYL